MFDISSVKSYQFIDITLYNFNIEASIAIYIDRDRWSTLLGDTYIRTLYDTFGIDKFIILALNSHRRLIDLVLRSLEHIIRFMGQTFIYIDNTNHSDEQLIPDL